MQTLQTLKNRGFQVKEFGPFVLVHPSRAKFDWEAGELGCRSVILDRDGRVVSTGWPKFFNQGEWPEHDAVIAGDLAAGRAVITHKHDGSLLIRSVLPDGRVLFRTRDTFDGGRFAALAESVARARYPRLLDPAVHARGSLLFEYVGAENQIVVRYNGEDDLILIGAADHGPAGQVAYAPFPALAALARDLELRLVETYDWTAGGIAGILDQVRHWDSAEGVVVRSHCGQVLLKIKSAWYFAQHALRWQMTFEAICRFAIDGGITDEPALVAALMQAGWDHETTITARALFARYSAARVRADAVKQAALDCVAAFDRETAGTLADERARRKAFAARLFGPDATPEARAHAPYRFLAYDGRIDRLDAMLLRHVVLGQNRHRSEETS